MRLRRRSALRTERASGAIRGKKAMRAALEWPPPGLPLKQGEEKRRQVRFPGILDASLPLLQGEVRWGCPLAP